MGVETLQLKMKKESHCPPGQVQMVVEAVELCERKLRLVFTNGLQCELDTYGAYVANCLKHAGGVSVKKGDIVRVKMGEDGSILQAVRPM